MKTIIELLQEIINDNFYPSDTSVIVLVGTGETQINVSRKEAQEVLDLIIEGYE